MSLISLRFQGECKMFLKIVVLFYVLRFRYAFKEPKELHELYIEEIIKPKIFHSV